MYAATRGACLDIFVINMPKYPKNIRDMRTIMDHGLLPGELVHFVEVNPLSDEGKLEFQLRKRIECIGPVGSVKLVVRIVHIVEVRLVVVVGTL